MDATPYLIAVGAIGVVFVLPAFLAFRKEEAVARAELDKAEAAGRREPVSIRPWVDPSRCMGSGACVSACPENRVLQVLDGQATLVNASACVGHAACEDACPMNAIELVFGSEKRGVDLPEVGSDFSSNVPGLFIAGELGGMGLISNAVVQGIQAVSQLRRGLTKGTNPVDLVVVGAGPAGIAAGLEARRAGLRVEVIEQGEFGGAIRHYPRAKLVMSHGFQLPGRRRVPSGTMSKEELIAELSDAVADGELPIAEHERVLGVERLRGRLIVRTDARTLECTRVLLAVGRRGTPRTLGCPGEDLEKVAYRLLEPAYHDHQHVLVVGGGDSAVEAAVALADVPGTTVTLSYRRVQLTRPKQANLDRLRDRVVDERVDVVLNSTVAAIHADRVLLSAPDGERVIANDAVYVFAGGVLPTAFLADAGVTLQRHFGKRIERLVDASERPTVVA